MYLQRWHGWCCCLLGAFCVHHTTMPHVTSCKAKVHAYLAVTCHLHFRQNDRGILRATAVTRGWNGYRNKSQCRNQTPRTGLRNPSWRKVPESGVRSVHPGEENYPAAPAGIRTPRPFDHESGALTTELSQLPDTLACLLYY